MRKDNMYRVYIIGEVIEEAEDGPILSPMVKIGVAGDAFKRLRQLQTANPRELMVLHSRRFDTRREAIVAEAQAHAELSEFRASGEWFRVNVETAVDCIGFR